MYSTPVRRSRTGAKGFTLARKSSVTTHDATRFFAGFFAAIVPLSHRVKGGSGQSFPSSVVRLKRQNISDESDFAKPVCVKVPNSSTSQSTILEAFFISTGIVALGEIGDKTQLLAFVLAARFQRPLPIVFGILIATLLNHDIAASLGSWVTSLVEPKTLRWILGVSFIAMAGWMLIPDKFNKDDIKLARFGVFGTTLLAFFLAEMGDKTQIATVALAAQYRNLFAVIDGPHVDRLNRQPYLLRLQCHGS